ncbi:NosL [compost metagenome]
MDNKFGAVMLNKNGKSFKFDSAECMIDYSNEKPEHSDSYFVTDFSKAGSYISAREAVFLHGENVKSPMGGNIAAFSSKDDAAKMQQELKGDLLTWEEVKVLRKK